ncbi:MAG: GNAT family N-acetyltransferase [Candidatus Sericytochromatia bacterium]|nr:GNAT family N-acetyltransferase [Candidatus Sericytochromatia bacterium]
MTPSPRPVTTVRVVEDEADWAAARAIRFAVFVDEQGFPAANELDAYDAVARHWLLVSDDGAPLATARAVALPSGAWKIGRVAVAREARGLGLGAALMRALLSAARDAGVSETLLDSQVQATGFYASLGYVAEGPEFLEAGCPHRRMRRLEPA